ncbi:MAG TPA: O-antigen ligase family protein [Acidimicrobiales bacterium]|nr:O-antigen ligase family protein [Acidimicrobiales bacterium]
MSVSTTLSRLRTPAPALVRAEAEAAAPSEASVRRRIGWIWGLLFLNVLPYSAKSVLVPMPTSIGKIITQGALGVAIVLALSINRKVLVRPNLFLIFMSILCVTAAMMSIRGYFGFGSMVRCGRLIGMISVLWLLTPWWGRRDLLFLKYHRRALAVVLGTVVVGLVFFHGRAFAQAGGGRLGGAIWPIPPTQVAHYAAVLAGTTVVLWFTGLVKPRTAAVMTIGGIGIIVLSHTRTALVAFLVALLVASLSLFLSRKRVRKAILVTVVIAALIALCFAPFLGHWFTRGQTSKQLTNLTGRGTVWTAVKAEPRQEVNVLFGYGMSNDSFNGLPIDSSWYSTYLDQGVFGDVVDGGVLLLLLLIAAFSPRGPRRSTALFLVVYCLIASFTETGLGEASPYLLDLAVAMSLLMMPATASPSGELVTPGLKL